MRTPAVATACLLLVGLTLGVNRPAQAAGTDIDVRSKTRDPADTLYQLAIEAVAAGREDEAFRLLDALVTHHPGAPAVPYARALRHTLGEGGTARPRGPLWADLSLGRLELTLAMIPIAGLNAAMMGAALGEEDGVPPGFLTGALLGPLLAVLSTRDGIPHGRATAITSAGTWAIGNGVALHSRLKWRPDKYAHFWIPPALSVSAMLGMTLITWNSAPSIGDVSFANSVGLWSGVLGYYGAMTANVNRDGHIYHYGYGYSYTRSSNLLSYVVLSADAGLLIGGFLARHVEFSRKRILLTDLGGLTGAAVGMLFSTMANRRAAGAIGLSTTLLGLGTAFVLTKDIQASSERDEPVALFLHPAPGGGIAGVSWRG